jgi:hypothetical protein
LVELAEEGLLQLTYAPNFAGIKTDNTGTARERYLPVVFSIHARQGGPPRGLDDFVPQVFEEITGRRGASRRLAKKLYRHIRQAPVPDRLATRVEADFLDQRFVRQAIGRVLTAIVPEYTPPLDLRFDVEKLEDGLRVLTTLDLVAANAVYHQRVPVSHSSITIAYLLAHILTARETLEAAAGADADLSADPAHSAVASLMVETSIGRSVANLRRLQAFQDFVFDNGHAIREAVNSGEKDFRDVLALLKHARQFREWVAGKPPDADLAKEYTRACTRETWAERLPSKAVKWSMFTAGGLLLDALGLGGLGTAAGVTLSAVDGFLIDPMLRGWRPSQFVEQKLRPFVESG